MNWRLGVQWGVTVAAAITAAIAIRAASIPSQLAVQKTTLDDHERRLTQVERDVHDIAVYVRNH